MEEVPRISALLSDDARRGWDRWCTEHGVTLSGLLEAIGQLLHERATVDLEVAVERARRIDKDRGSR